MAIPNTGGGFQVGDGNLNEAKFGVQSTPATIPAGATATITAAQLATGLIVASPGATGSTYTLPTVALWEALVVNAHTDTAFDFAVINLDGNTSGIITLAVGTGWTLVGLTTLAATAGIAGIWRARKTGTGAWTAYRLA